jgi:hypothetical protein
VRDRGAPVQRRYHRLRPIRRCASSTATARSPA